MVNIYLSSINDPHLYIYNKDKFRSVTMKMTLSSL